MKNENNKNGKKQLYNDETSRYGEHLEQRRSSAGKPSGTAGPEKPDRIRSYSRDRGSEALRRREQENNQKRKILFGILGILILILIAALIYEVILGNGTRQTGQERMNQQNSIQTDLQQNPSEKETEKETQGEVSPADVAGQKAGSDDSSVTEAPDQPETIELDGVYTGGV